MSADGETQRRLTLTDAYKDARHVIDQLTTRSTSEPSASVEITRNAKGEVQFSVKVYAAASADEADVKRVTGLARNQAEQAFESLNTTHAFGVLTWKGRRSS